MSGDPGGPSDDTEKGASTKGVVAALKTNESDIFAASGSLIYLDAPLYHFWFGMTLLTLPACSSVTICLMLLRDGGVVHMASTDYITGKFRIRDIWCGKPISLDQSGDGAEALILLGAVGNLTWMRVHNDAYRCAHFTHSSSPLVRAYPPLISWLRCYSWIVISPVTLTASIRWLIRKALFMLRQCCILTIHAGCADTFPCDKIAAVCQLYRRNKILDIQGM